MLYLTVSVVLLLATAYALRGGLVGQDRALTIAGLDRNAVGLGLLAVGAAGFLYGWTYGLALIFTVALHEFGHVAAYRVCGHRDARFRLIPLFGGLAISDSLPSRQDKDFFISLLGPAICIAPMVLATAILSLVPTLMGTNGLSGPAIALFETLWAFVTVCGLLNLFNLLPLWPLDGGRCIVLLCNSFWPAGVRQVVLGMWGALFLAAIWMQAYVLFFFALMMSQSAFQAVSVLQVQKPMGRARAALAGAAYLATTGTFALASWPMWGGMLF